MVSSAAEGTSAPGYRTNDSGFVIDLGPMKGIQVDPEGTDGDRAGRVLSQELDQTPALSCAATTSGT